MIKPILKASALLASALFLSTPVWAAEALSDSQIAEVLNVANKGEIKAAKEAKSTASSPEVKQFAEQMITDHTQMLDANKSLAKRLNIRPEDSEQSKSLEDENDKAMKDLKGLKGAQFDKAYVASQIKMHQMVLDTINMSLLPNAKSQDMQTMLAQAVPAVQAHLKHAKDMQPMVR